MKSIIEHQGIIFYATSKQEKHRKSKKRTKPNPKLPEETAKSEIEKIVP